MRRILPRLVAAALALTACQSSTDSPRGDAVPPAITALPRALSVGETELVTATNRFAPSLLAHVNASRADENVFLSPLSASMALGMTMNGAAGATRDEMQAALGFGTTSQQAVLASYRDLISLLRTLDPKVDFRIANSIWYKSTFAPAIAPAFLAEAKQYFDATSQGLDFAKPASLSIVNDWVKTSTNGKIPTIVDALPDDLVMLLVNAIYFKGDWRQAFDRSQTANAPFATASGSSISVPMMHRTAMTRAGVVDGRTVVELGYGGDAFVMWVILPREGESVNALVDSLGATGWAIAQQLATMEVELTLPRFSLSWEATLNAPLQAMGMQRAFVGGDADFTRLAPGAGHDLYISFVKQKTFVDVNEIGTEAAAATAVGVGVVSLPQRMVVRVDRPFVFAIRERLSGTVLFVGKIVQPPTS